MSWEWSCHVYNGAQSHGLLSTTSYVHYAKNINIGLRLLRESEDYYLSNGTCHLYDIRRSVISLEIYILHRTQSLSY